MNSGDLVQSNGEGLFLKSKKLKHIHPPSGLRMHVIQNKSIWGTISDEVSLKMLWSIDYVLVYECNRDLKIIFCR